MTFEDEQIAEGKARRIQSRIESSLAEKETATPADLIKAINAAYAGEDPEDGELTYEMDEEWQPEVVPTE